MGSEAVLSVSAGDLTEGKAPARLLEPVNERMPIAPQIYERLRRAIITLVLLPAEGLSEKELSQQLGVSRTPVREALIRLADEGLIDILPQRGSFVAPIRLREVEEAQFIREALEVAVVRRLTGNASPAFLRAAQVNLDQQAETVCSAAWMQFLELDEAFHRMLCEEAGLPKSWRLIQAVKLQLDRVRYISLPESGHLRLLLDQHRSILDAIANGQKAEAVERMTVHLQEVLRTVQRLKKKGADHLVD